MYKPLPERNLQQVCINYVEQASTSAVITAREVYREARSQLPDMWHDSNEYRLATRSRITTMRRTVAAYLTKLVSVGVLIRTGTDEWMKIRALPRENTVQPSS